MNKTEKQNAFKQTEKWIREREEKIRNMAKLRHILETGEPFEPSWEKQFIDGTQYLKTLLNDAKTQIRQNERPKV